MKKPYRNGPLELAQFLDLRALEQACRSDVEFEAAFGTEERCQRWWIARRWPRGFECPRCRGSGRFCSKRRGFECRRCRKFTSLVVGTRLEGTKKPLRKWFEAIYLITQRGVNARTLQRELRLTYKVAWAWGHKLRRLLGPLAAPPDLRPPRERHHASFDAERKWLGPRPQLPRADRPGPCGCTKLTKRDWGWPNEIEEEREATRLWRLYDRGVHHSKLWPEVLPAPDTPHHCSEVAHWELNATYYGSLSEKHLRCYLDELAFRMNRQWRPHHESFFSLVAEVPHAPALTYRQIVAKPALEGHALSIFDTGRPLKTLRRPS